jgi:hypothetical protein
MAQDEQLDVLCKLAAPAADQQPQQSREGEIGEGKKHEPMLSSPGANSSKKPRRLALRQPTVATPNAI